MLISVIIPVYNVESTLKRAVLSVLEQTNQNFEIILVDDGSTDRSGIFCDELAKDEARVSVIHKQNGGLSSARNAGIESAKGDFISFLDSDDYFDLSLFDKFFDSLNQHPDLEIYMFNLQRIVGNAAITQEGISGVSEDKGHNVSLLFDYSGVNFFAWNKIAARRLFETVRFPEGKLYEDTMPSYMITKLADKVVTTADVGIYYIQNEGSIVASSFNPKQYDNVTERIRLLKEIEQDFPHLKGRALNRVLDGFLSTGYKIASSKKTAFTDDYYKILKVDSRAHMSLLKDNLERSKLKILALQLLLFNKKLYKRLYKTYLGK